VNKVDGPIFVMDILPRNSRILIASCAGTFLYLRNHWSGQSSGLFLRIDSRNLASTS
jgi:hypothetical protein